MGRTNIAVPVIGMGLLGVLFAILVEQMVNAGFIIDVLVTASLTVEELQAAVILVWIIGGFLIGIGR